MYMASEHVYATAFRISPWSFVESPAPVHNDRQNGKDCNGSVKCRAKVKFQDKEWEKLWQQIVILTAWQIIFCAWWDCLDTALLASLGTRRGRNDNLQVTHN